MKVPLQIWIVTPGEPLPIDAGGVRLLRHGLLAAMMVERGWHVTWWTSNFDHTSKVKRAPGSQAVTRTITPSYRIILLPSSGYRRNVSMARLIDHRQIAAAFTCETDKETPPDIILCSYPTLELASAATRYGQRHGVPVVLDIRDLWPDIFTEVVPPSLRWLARCLLWPYEFQGSRAIKRAKALIGITEPIVAWACAKAGRPVGLLDKSFPLACPDPQAIDDYSLQQATQGWAKLGADKERFVLSYLGALGRQSDFETVLQAASLLEQACPQAMVVICGQGEALPRLQEAAKTQKNVIVPGWINHAQLRSLIQLSSAGVAPYFNEYSYTLSVPNKVIEYLSGGLPVLSCLRGSTEALIKTKACGVFYQELNPASLRDAVVQLFEDASLRARLAENALHLYQCSFTARQVYGDMIEHLSNIADSRLGVAS